MKTHFCTRCYKQTRVLSTKPPYDREWNMQNKCKTVLHGNKRISPAEMFERMAEWCRENNVEHDIYGQGKLIQAFEQKVADLLGFEAGLFVITGTMTQPTALQIACQEKQCANVAMHPTSHVYLHERQGYQLQQRFNVLPVGEPYQPWTVEHLEAITDPLAAVLYELPMREIGGQLPEFEHLQAVKDYCANHNFHLHMDGARVWEAAAWYQKSYQEVAQGFHSAYVSMYKGVNGLGGAMLLGDKSFIRQADTWMKRQGGNVWHRTPYVVAAMMQFDERIAAMPALFERTKQLYTQFGEFPLFTLNPTAPQSNMLHIYLPLSESQAKVLRDELAEEHSIWIGNPQQAALPEQSSLEWYVGDLLLNMEDELLHQTLRTIHSAIAAKLTP